MKIIETKKFAYKRNDFPTDRPTDDSELTPADRAKATEYAKKIISGEGYAQVLQGVKPKLVALVKQKIEELS